MQKNSEVAVRWEQFCKEHKDFDSTWARSILHNLSEFLPYVFSAVPDGLKQLYVKSGVRFPPDFDWKEQWYSASDDLPATTLRELPIFKLALAFRAYAYYGLLLDDGIDGPGAVLGEWLSYPCEASSYADHPYLSFCRQWIDRETDDTISAAVGRWKLDHKTHGGLTPEELAALARVSRKSVMNLIAPGKNGALEKDADGRITVDSATRWLLARPEFRPSVWQQQDGTLTNLKWENSVSVQPLFVPVAGDGSWFSPVDRHQRDGQYYVGNSDDERKFDDYWTALDFLARAGSPRWRYTDAMGRWRIKTGKGWERKSRQEVEDLLPGPADIRVKEISDGGQHDTHETIKSCSRSRGSKNAKAQ
jgi:hypothetical protein